MSRKIRVGVVGTSQYAVFVHYPALRSHPQAELAAICGRNRERADKMAAEYNVPQVFTDYKAMISRGGLDAIIVAAPDDLHYAITMQALDAGLHVLCEKPIALTAQQAWEMYEKAEKIGVKNMVMFSYRWMPFFRYFSDLVRQGYVGRCYHCEFRYLMGYGRNGEYKWQFDRRRANGALADMGSHMIDLARWLVGDVSGIRAQLGTFVDRPGADGEPIDPANDAAFLLVDFANGAHGMIHVNAVACVAERFMQQQINLYGEAGSLEIDVPYGWAEGPLIRSARNQDEQFQILDVPARYWGTVSWSELFDIFSKEPVGTRAFVDAILEDHPITPTFYDGYKAQQVIDAALKADQSGEKITID